MPVEHRRTDAEPVADDRRTSSPNDLLSRDDIERETGGGLSRRWLELAALRGDGPPFIKISHRCVRYRRADLDAWLAARTVRWED